MWLQVDTLGTWSIFATGNGTGEMTHTLELCFELPGDLSLPQTKVPCLSGASCTTPVGSPTCGHMDLHEALDPDPRHRTSTCVAWTRKSQQRSLSYGMLRAEEQILAATTANLSSQARASQTAQTTRWTHVHTMHC